MEAGIQWAVKNNSFVAPRNFPPKFLTNGLNPKEVKELKGVNFL